MKHSILCVDDELDNVEALERLLRSKYRVLKATSGAEGLEILAKEPVSLIISDQRMPQMTGVQFLAKSMEIRPEAIRFLLTGYTDVESVIDAINSGHVYRYLTKPWDPVDLTNAVDKALEKFELSAELKEKNAALQSALSELKTLDQAKNQFMILINHELKTPLTVMLSFLQLLEDSGLNEEQDRYVARVQAAALRLQTLVDDALELVSAEARSLKINPSSVPVGSVFKDLDTAFRDQALAKGQNIRLDFAQALKARADEKILRSVFRRLLDNAIKFGDANSEILLSARGSDSGAIEFSITNQGKSLDAAKIQKILKPFTLDEDIMHHSKGTGLGLSVSQALLKAHNSGLKIECPKGHFRVSFSLPVD